MANIELRHFRYFVAVAEDLHFGRAAERLGISQPPLSQQIQMLERELGARLFERTNRRVELTEAGRLFLGEARAALDQVERAATVAGRANRGEVGELTVGFFGSAPFTQISQAVISAFRKTHPSVHLALQEMPTLQQVDALMERRLAIGFLRPVSSLPDLLVARELGRERLLAVMREDHPLAKQRGTPLPLDALAAEPFVFFPRGIGTGLHDTILALCRKAGFNPRVSQEAHATPTIIGLVAAGLGVSILPASLQRLHMEGVVFRPLAEKDAETAVWLVHRRDARSALVRGFIELALREAKTQKNPSTARKARRK